MTNTQVVRYRTADWAADANQEAIEKVFDQIREHAPADLSYRVYRHGTEFLHIVATDTDPLGPLPAFQEFLTGLRTRLAVEPQFDVVEMVGEYCSADAEGRYPHARTTHYAGLRSGVGTFVDRDRFLGHEALLRLPASRHLNR